MGIFSQREVCSKVASFLPVLLLFHILGISLGLRTDQLFGLVTLIFSLAFLWVYYITGEIPSRLYQLLDRRLVFLLISLYLLMWLAVIFLKERSFQYHLFDTGIFSHNLITFLKTGSYYSSILAMPALADHFTPLLLLFSPLFAIEESIIWLPLIRLLAYAASFYFLYKITKSLGFPPFLQSLFLLFWLLQAPYVQVLRFEFQPSSLGIPIVLAAFYLILEKKILGAYVILLSVLGLKENMVLNYALFALYFLFYERSIKLFLLWFFSALVFGFAIYFSIPIITQSPVHHESHFGLWEAWDKKILFVLKLLPYFALLPLFSLRSLLLFSASCALSFLSRHPNMFTLNYHYHDIPTLFGLITSLLVVKNIQEGRISLWRKYQFHLKPLLFLLFLWVNTKTPARTLYQAIPREEHRILQREIEMLKSMLHGDEILVVQENIGASFLSFPHLKSLNEEDWLKYKDIRELHERLGPLVLFIFPVGITSLEIGHFPESFLYQEVKDRPLIPELRYLRVYCFLRGESQQLWQKGCLKSPAGRES